MNITNVISDSLLAGSYFGLHKNVVTYKAIASTSEHKLNGVLRVDTQVYRIARDGTAYPHTFTIADILNTGWEVRTNAGELSSDKPVYHGIILASLEGVEMITELFEKDGYGIIDSVQEHSNGQSTIFCRSHLFIPNVAGEATPKYMLEYEDDTKTLTARVNSV